MTLTQPPPRSIPAGRLLVAVVVVGLIVVGGLFALVASRSPVRSGLPVLADARGYGRYLGVTSSDLLFQLDCVARVPGGAPLAAGRYQEPLAGLVIVVANGPQHTEVISALTFVHRQLSHQFRGYVQETPGQGLVTSAVGATGCAGPITEP